MGNAAGLPDFDALWDYDHPERTERRFRELLHQTDPIEDEVYRLELLTQIARGEGLQGRFDNARHTLDQVAARLPETTPRVRSRYLLERGRVLNT